MKQFILGGTRSGKSALAERLAAASGKTVRYIATTDRSHNDVEMEQRIAQHLQQRPSQWRTTESPIELASAITQYASSDSCLLIDCLTLWISNCLLSDDPQCWPVQRQQLLASLVNVPGDIIIVSNEVGQGLIAMDSLSRRFVDASGLLHQRVAEHCDRVILTVAGLPMALKGTPI